MNTAYLLAAIGALVLITVAVYGLYRASTWTDYRYASGGPHGPLQDASTAVFFTVYILGIAGIAFFLYRGFK